MPLKAELSDDTEDMDDRFCCCEGWFEDVAETGERRSETDENDLVVEDEVVVVTVGG